jgi:hypothetical protein
MVVGSAGCLLSFRVFPTVVVRAPSSFFPCYLLPRNSYPAVCSLLVLQATKRA